MMTAKKFSILGLVLIMASAVAGAIIPSKENANDHVPIPGTLVADSDGEMTCSPKVVGQSCTVTASSSTTGDNMLTSDDDHSGSSSTDSPDGDGHTGIPGKS